MRAKKMQAMIKEMTEKGVSTSDIAKALFTADRKARTERNTSDRRRKVWRTLNDVKPGVSYQQMTACVWDFIGASLKDAGKKCFAVSEMKDAGRSLMNKLAGIK